MLSPLPIDAALPRLLDMLGDSSAAVLVAPPGAGKTTRVAPALLDQPWCLGEVLLIVPRRIAARAAAERMAWEAGEPVGRLFGYLTRLDSRRSAGTRVTAMTPGVFRSRIQADPELAGVSAVLFDEVHERALEADLGLALAIDAQGGLRPDLRLLAMSATLDGARFARLLGNAPVLESEGRSFPLDLRHIGRRAELRIEDEVAGTVRRALADGEGGVLAFLPGVAEIERVAERLDDLPSDVVLHRLHGSLEPERQRAAIAPAAPGTRKLVLATAIAETSLTLDGVSVVVDSGLARRARYDRAAGVTRLLTERVSQAAATQRAGRAARQRPGVAFRLWEEAATAGLPPFDPPEILEADLSGLLLDCAIWGVGDPRTLAWLDPPPEAALAEARARLLRLGALDADGRVTAHGRAIARLPLAPRLGHMLVAVAPLGLARVAAEVAALLSERGLGGPSVDLAERRERWHRERGARAEGARGLARRWAGLAPDGPGASDGTHGTGEGTCLALAFPDRVARRRDGESARWASVGGRGFTLDPLSPLARAEWLAVGETQGSAAGARILSAAAISREAIEALFAAEIAEVREVRFDPETRSAVVTRERRLGALRLGGGTDDAPDREALAACLSEGVRGHGLDLLPWTDEHRALQGRVAFARSLDPSIPDLSDVALAATLDAWLPPLLAGLRRLDRIDPGALGAALDGQLGWEGRRRLDRVAPSHLETPAGSRHPIDYLADGGPAVELRPQALFGLGRHPMVGEGRVPLTLVLVSPAGRPIQVTKDLPGFWAGSWAAVAREMRGRYPRHPWPDDPAAAAPTLRTKRAGA